MLLLLYTYCILQVTEYKYYKTFLMHATVQHKPSSSHSMFIKVATVDNVLRHSEKQKHVFCDSVMVQADLKRFCYMHWHFWIRTKVTTFLSSSASFEWFRVLKTCFGMAVREICTGNR